MHAYLKSDFTHICDKYQNFMNLAHLIQFYLRGPLRKCHKAAELAIQLGENGMYILFMGQHTRLQYLDNLPKCLLYTPKLMYEAELEV